MHGTGVAKVDWSDAGTFKDDCDALVTDAPGLPLFLVFADCVPVLLYDPQHHALGVCHAGWRGTVNGAAIATLWTLQAAYDTVPATVRACLGPSIGPASYAVGDEVIAMAHAKLKDAEQLFVYPDGAHGQAHFDLWAANRSELVAAGVPDGSIEVAGIDTATNTADFFSHRADPRALRPVWHAGLACAGASGRCSMSIARCNAHCRFSTALPLAFFLLLALSTQGRAQQADGAAGATLPGMPNRLTNADFECDSGGYYSAQNSRGKTILIPNDWTMVSNGDSPDMKSARIWVVKSCDTSSTKHVEKISGSDSFFVAVLDLETPPTPGKPFDVSIYQQVAAAAGVGYSLSGWQLTLCGGSNTVPKNDCPSDYYMAKMLGIDPTGGTDPNSPNVVWGENRNNFVDANNQRIGWSNVRTSTVAQGDKITVFARIHSPFQWHGNHGFIDALSLVQAPVATLNVTTSTLQTGAGVNVKLAWDGSLGADIPTIQGGNYQPLYDVEYWHGTNSAWRELQDGYSGAGSMEFAAALCGRLPVPRARARRTAARHGELAQPAISGRVE